jgi:hypothetical protein
LPPQSFALVAHAGYSGGTFWDKAYGNGYLDWSVGLTRSVGRFKVGLSFIDGSDLPHGAGRVFDTRNRFVASLSTTLPWSAN